MNLKFDPYRAMFPIGLFLGVWGVGSWLLYGFNITSTYPGTYHATIMIGGFLFLMAVGFLMTAVPAFTDTQPASPWELGIAIFLSLVLGIAGIADQPTSFHRIIFYQMLFLVFFGIRRVLKRKENPPPSFIFVGLGILCGIFGDGLMCLEDNGQLSGKWSVLGHNLFFQGMMLSLVLGVGSRLLPALMGWEEFPLVQISTSTSKETKQNFLHSKTLFLIMSALVLIFSFSLEAFTSLQMGRILRALITSLVAFRFWNLHRFPLEKTWLSRWLWISGWCVIIGLWGYAIFPTYGVHLLHITFIGGFSLMTIMIATRVTIAHGDEEYELERSSKALKWAGVFILVAMVTRILAPFTAAAYRSHLGYASITWIIALLFWGTVFIKRVVIH